MSAKISDYPDHELLKRFASDLDEAAFRALVEKYTRLVYGVALRRTANPLAAEEVAQNVFLALAKKARSLADQRSIGAWLHRATTLESLKSLREHDTRNRHLAMIREQQSDEVTEEEDQWHDIRPHLDQLLDKLPAKDREIIVQHFFEGLPFSEIAQRVGTTAAAAQKRSRRALEKLRSSLKRTGVAVPATAIAAGLGAELARAAPASLASQISAQVVSASAGAIAAAPASSIFIAMTTSKLVFVASFVLAASIPVGLRVLQASAQERSSNSGATLAISGKHDRLAEAERATGFSIEAFRSALERLIKEEQNDPADVRRLRRLMFTLERDEILAAVTMMEEFVKEHELSDMRLEIIAGALFSRWAEIDGFEATERASSMASRRMGGWAPVQEAWRVWALRDWEAALAWSSPPPQPIQTNTIYWSHINDLAKIDGELLMQHVAQMEDPTDMYARQAITQWSDHAPQAAAAWIVENLTTDARIEKIARSGLLRIGEQHPAIALDHFELLNKEGDEVYYGIFEPWSIRQPEAAANYFERSNAGDNWEANTVSRSAQAIARHLPERALKLANQIEDLEKRAHFYDGILRTASESDDLTVVLEAAEAFEHRELWPNDGFSIYIKEWARRDAATASSWVESLADGEKKRLGRVMVDSGIRKRAAE